MDNQRGGRKVRQPWTRCLAPGQAAASLDKVQTGWGRPAGLNVTRANGLGQGPPRLDRSGQKGQGPSGLDKVRQAWTKCLRLELGPSGLGKVRQAKTRPVRAWTRSVRLGQGPNGLEQTSRP